jgi:Flp pilus assembly protein TadG
MNTFRNSRGNGERGQILPMVGVLIVVFMGFLAIAVDLGQGYLQRRANQNGADAAAVAAEQGLLAGSGDSSLQSAIRNILLDSGYKNYTITFASAASPNAGSDPTTVYVDAQYGRYPSGSSSCTPWISSQYVGNGTIPNGTKCVKVIVSTSKKTLFASAPVLGFPQIGASAQSSAGLVSVVAPDTANGGGAFPTPTPTPAPWDTGSGEGWAIWGGNRADGTILSQSPPSTVLFFADSGWNVANDVQTNCPGSCEYQATQNFKGIADPQCFQVPLVSQCTGPNGALGNAAASIPPGNSVELVVVSSVDHDGNSNTLNPIGLVTVKVLPFCPADPAFLSNGVNAVCGQIIPNTLIGALNEGYAPVTPVPAAAPVIGNTK